MSSFLCRVLRIISILRRIINYYVVKDKVCQAALWRSQEKPRKGLAPLRFFLASTTPLLLHCRGTTSGLLLLYTPPPSSNLSFLTPLSPRSRFHHIHHNFPYLPASWPYVDIWLPAQSCPGNHQKRRSSLEVSMEPSSGN